MKYFLLTLASLVMGLVFAPPLIAVAPMLLVGLALIAAPMLLHRLGQSPGTDGDRAEPRSDLQPISAPTGP